MDGDVEYVFQASGDACGACQALDGTTYTGQPHDNCMCQAVPQESECQTSYSFTTNRWGPGDYDGSIGGEITVICPDGTEISESFEFDLSPYAGGDGTDVMDLGIDAFDAEAEALCEQCPVPEPFLCC